MKPSLMLNMIVRNESARIERCLQSLLPHVKSIAILDTGSTDDTDEIINKVAFEAGVPCVVRRGEFRDFSQARNDAFKLAQEVNGKELPFTQFALLCDADMELVVEDHKTFLELDANAASYDMLQKAGSLSYLNRRLVNLNIQKAPYVGVTHEYIDVVAAAKLEGAYFVDHADGSNRKDKYERDARLLEAASVADPSNGRTWYYLANTYRDAGRWADAAQAYTRRIAIGGWDEEVHSAMMHRADCHRKMGDEGAFVSQMVAAYSFRPRRAEPLYDLAVHFRGKGDNAAALLFAKGGLDKPRPDDALFVNDFVYQHGLRYEYSIAGYYDDKERPRAMAVANDLALDASCPAGTRYSARNNLYWGTAPLEESCSSFKAKRINFTPPAGYTAMNPSIEEFGGVVSCNIRCVNYRIDEHGRYLINGTDGTANGSNPIDTRNFVVELDAGMNCRSAREIVWERPDPAFNLVTGLEDVRLWRNDDGQLKFNAAVRELLPSGVPQQVKGSLTRFNDDVLLVDDWLPISDGSQCEKNWMHFKGEDFIYRLNTIMRVDRKTVEWKSPLYTGDISGSSQCIPFKNGYLCVVHEASEVGGKRNYWHRFAWMREDGKCTRISKPFVFFARQIEFCAGLAWAPSMGALLISFGVRDCEAWVGHISVEDVALMLWRENDEG